MATLLIDFNNLAVRTFCSKEIESDTEYPNIKLWKYFTTDSVYKAMFKEHITEVVLAVDDKKSWRKIFWERYKEKRRKQREASKINWDVFHSEYVKFCNEIRHYLPFKVIQVENAEADDIIAILSKKDNGDYIIVSNDEDYIQLCSENIKVYNPQRGEFRQCDDTEKFLVILSLTGQAKDGIFNIKTPLDWPADKRKPGFGEKSAEKIIEYGYEKWLKENNLEERYKVNRILLDFEKIPEAMKTRIMNVYSGYKMPDPSNIYKFFEKNAFKGFLEDFSNVESKFLSLY